MTQLVFFVIVLLAMYVLLVRPQQQRVAKHHNFVQSLQVGEEIVTTGGMIGTISGLDDDQVVLRSPSGIELTFVRAAVNHRVTEEEGK